jgi:hypothetical protein
MRCDDASAWGEDAGRVQRVALTPMSFLPLGCLLARDIMDTEPPGEDLALSRGLDEV